MRSLFIIVPLFVIAFFAGWFGHVYFESRSSDSKDVLSGSVENIVKPLEKYSIENMQKATFTPGVFKIEKEIADEEKYKSYLFSYTFNPEVITDVTKTTTGQINIPKEGESFPVVLMFRGFVDQNLYTTGTGTRPAAKYFAENGFITIAPDFLGYADSDSESGNIFETRFQTYTTAISLLKSIEQFSYNHEIVKVNSDIPDSQLITNLLITNNLFLWAHSNGGQVALTTLEVTGAEHPTTLWAPVTKPFPYSILYYTDESQDGGKFIRKELAEFETLYDTDKYSLTNYLDNIKAPIQLHQGTSDSAVPAVWSGEFATRMKSKDKDIKYFTYPGADHNLRPDWDSVVEKDVEFFKEHSD